MGSHVTLSGGPAGRAACAQCGQGGRRARRHLPRYLDRGPRAPDHRRGRCHHRPDRHRPGAATTPEVGSARSAGPTGYTSPGYRLSTHSSSSAVIGRPVRLRHHEPMVRAIDHRLSVRFCPRGLTLQVTNGDPVSFRIRAGIPPRRPGSADHRSRAPRRAFFVRQTDWPDALRIVGEARRLSASADQSPAPATSRRAVIRSRCRCGTRGDRGGAFH